jgi:hypothetical protein
MPMVHYKSRKASLMTPLEKVEALYEELVAHYGAGEVSLSFFFDGFSCLFDQID